MHAVYVRDITLQSYGRISLQLTVLRPAVIDKCRLKIFDLLFRSSFGKNIFGGKFQSGHIHAKLCFN